jgi:CHASE3 domain sensor protein
MTDLRSGSADRRSASLNREPLPAGVRLTVVQRSAATGGIAAVVLLLGVLTFDGIRNTRDARHNVAQTHRVIETAQATLQDITNAETGQRGFLFTGKDRYLAPCRSALLALTSDTTSLRRMTGADPNQRRQLDTLSERIDYKLAELAATIRLKRLAHPDSAIALVSSDRGRKAMDAIRVSLRALSASVEELQQQTDLSEQARAAAEEASIRTEEANRAKSLEIRGPLVDAQREDLRRIKKSGQHLL